MRRPSGPNAVSFFVTNQVLVCTGVEVASLAEYWRTKDELYTFFKVTLQVLVPTKKQCRVGKYFSVLISLFVAVEYLRQLLNGEKKQLKLSDVTQVNVPNYPEVSLISVSNFFVQLAVKKLWPQVSAAPVS